MQDSVNDLIVGILAQQLGIDPKAVRPEQRLCDDLGLQPLGVVQVALRVEDALEHAELPFERIASAKTVGELAVLVGSAVRACLQQRRLVIAHGATSGASWTGRHAPSER